MYSYVAFLTLPKVWGNACDIVLVLWRGGSFTSIVNVWMLVVLRRVSSVFIFYKLRRCCASEWLFFFFFFCCVLLPMSYLSLPTFRITMRAQFLPTVSHSAAQIASCESSCLILMLFPFWRHVGGGALWLCLACGEEEGLKTCADAGARTGWCRCLAQGHPLRAVFGEDSAAGCQA